MGLFWKLVIIELSLNSKLIHDSYVCIYRIIYFLNSIDALFWALPLLPYYSTQTIIVQCVLCGFSSLICFRYMHIILELFCGVSGPWTKDLGTWMLGEKPSNDIFVDMVSLQNQVQLMKFSAE